MHRPARRLAPLGAYLSRRTCLFALALATAGCAREPAQPHWQCNEDFVCEVDESQVVCPEETGVRPRVGMRRAGELDVRGGLRRARGDGGVVPARRPKTRLRMMGPLASLRNRCSGTIRSFRW